MTAALDLFYLFVENVFGNFLFAVIGLSVLLGLMGMAGRMSLLLVFSVVVLFLMSMLIGFFGSVVAIMSFSFALIYFFWNLVSWVKGAI